MKKKMTYYEFLVEHNNLTVAVDYPDGTYRYTNLERLAKKFEDETEEWKEWFFNSLMEDGFVRTDYAKYTLNR